MESRYGGWFECNGYRFLTEGLIHNIYEKDGYIYKIVKEDRPLFCRENHFERERNILNMLRAEGFPVVLVERIFQPGELIEGFQVLQERKITDALYDEVSIPKGCVDAVLEFLSGTAALPAPGFGVIYGDREYEFETWDAFVDSLIETACGLELDGQQDVLTFLRRFAMDNREAFAYCGNARFLVMDPNPQNFFFQGDVVTKAIDIDHPLGGDPLWQWACVYWYKPAWKENMERLGVVRDTEKRLLLYTALFGMNCADFEIRNIGSPDGYTLDRMKKLASEISEYTAED